MDIYHIYRISPVGPNQLM